MDAVLFVNELKRMCNSNEDCSVCQVAKWCNNVGYPQGFSEEMVAVVEKWSKEHPDFKVGDEVRFKGNATRFVVTSIGESTGYLNGIGANGAAFCDKNASSWEKTGRHFQEAEILMEKIKK